MPTGPFTNTPAPAQTIVGVDFLRVDASGAPTYTKGQRAFTRNGEEYMYVVAGSALALAQAVGVNASHSAVLLTKARADAGDRIGWALGTVTAGSYAWVQLSGPNVAVKVKNSCLPAVPLYTCGTNGTMDDTSASQTRLYGVRLNAANTATSSNVVRLAVVAPGGVVAG